VTSLQLTSPVLRAAEHIAAARNAIRVPSGASHAARRAISGQPPIIQQCRNRDRGGSGDRGGTGERGTIGKISAPRGTRAEPLIWYLYGPGRHEEHTDPHKAKPFSQVDDLPFQLSASNTVFRRGAGDR
jgi:hypothetical protein